MTNRRRSGRKAPSTSKKETPEKSRRSSRRRGHKKSDSEPEADDSVSDRSFEKQSQLDVDPLALTRNVRLRFSMMEIPTVEFYRKRPPMMGIKEKRAEDQTGLGKFEAKMETRAAFRN